MPYKYTVPVSYIVSKPNIKPEQAAQAGGIDLGDSWWLRDSISLDCHSNVPPSWQTVRRKLLDKMPGAKRVYVWTELELMTYMEEA